MFSSLPNLLKTLAGALSIYVIYCLYLRQQLASKHRVFAIAHNCKPLKRCKNWDPFFGLDFFYAQYVNMKSHTTLEAMASRFTRADTHNTIISVLGRTFIATIEPENLKAALATDFKSWGLGEHRKRHLGEFLGEGIFTTDGEAWKHSREVLRPSFARARIGDVEGFERHVKRFLKLIPRDGKTVVDLQPLFFEFTMDVATEFLFGESSAMLTREKGKALKVVDGGVTTEEFVDAFTYGQRALEGSEGAWGFFNLFLPNSALKRSYRTVHKYVDTIIERGLAEHANYKPDKSNYIFLHEIISQTSDKIKIRAELLNILVAGRDTTASLLSNVWFELSKRYEVRARLGREITTLNGRLPTFEQLKEMKYLNAIIKESLRLYPVVPENSRQALEDTILPLGGGFDEKSPVFVPKGWQIFYSVWAMHRRKDLFGEDAEEFKPERWLDEGGKKGLRVGWEYLPFNGGPRICIGQQFALTEACYITVRLMQQFSTIESRDSEPWREKLGITVTGLNGAKVVLIPHS